jgi:hypothetical protein
LGFDSVYKDYVARSCRTCHVALADSLYNFDIENNRFGVNAVCANGGTNPDLLPSHSMPNSLVTFNRFWLSGTALDHSANPVDQVALMNLFESGFGNPCVRGEAP